MNLYFIGYRGSGKTTVARLVAQRLGRMAIDADEELERRAGRSVSEIFRSDGEPAFRDLESQCLADLGARQDLIASLGGGVVLREANRQLLATTGKTVWLRASPATLWARMSGDPTTAARRPNLTATGGLAEIESLLAVRTPLYALCANGIIDTDGKSADELAEEVVEWWKG